MALLNSGIGVCIACTTSSTRTLYGMSRTGALPALFGAVHPRHKTPYKAVMVQSAEALLLCLGLGALYGPTNLFDIFGIAGTYAYILIYGLGNVAAWRYFRTISRENFNVIYHVVFPLIGTAALIYIGYESLDPVPGLSGVDRADHHGRLRRHRASCPDVGTAPRPRGLAGPGRRTTGHRSGTRHRGRAAGAGAARRLTPASLCRDGPVPRWPLDIRAPDALERSTNATPGTAAADP